jgi:hypothetical protein
MDKKVHVMTSKPVVEDIEATVSYPNLNDGWTDNISQLLHEKTKTEEFTKEYIRERLQGKFFPKEVHEETPRQKFMLGQMMNEMYDKFSDQLNVDDFVNSTTKLLNSFMAKDFLFVKNDLYSSKTDLDMFEAINEFTSEDMLTLMLKRVHSTLSKEKARLKKWKANLENHLLSNPVLEEDEILADRHPSLTARSKSFNNRCNRLKEQLLKLESEIMRLHEETSMLQNYKGELKEKFEAARGSFEKPNIDISAKVKMSSKHDHQKLDKMLFNMRDEKDVLLGLTPSRVEQSIVAEIAEAYKLAAGRLLLAYLPLVPNAVFAKRFTQHPLRLFSRGDSRADRIRAIHQSPDVVLKLDAVGIDLKQIAGQSNPRSTNFYEYIIEESGQQQDFYKFVFSKRKLTNLTISSESLNFMIDTWRLDDQSIGRTFKELIRTPMNREYFKETQNFPSFITEVLVDSMPFFSPKIFMAKFKTLSDQGVYSSSDSKEGDLMDRTAALSNNQAILGIWYGLLRDKEKLELFNQQVDNQFLSIVQVQNKYLEFSDYYDSEKAFDMNCFSKVGKNQDEETDQPLFKRFFNYINANEKIKVKKAFWVKEGLVFKLTQKQPNEHHSTILLKDQIKHPHIETWLQLVLNNDAQAINYDLLKFTTEMFEILDIKQESLLTEKKLTKGTLESYVKLLMLRSRNAVLRLLSYCNFSRAVQKNVNLRFIDLCEQHRQHEDLFEKIDLDKYRKDDLLKQTRMYDRKECEEIRRLFDEDVSVCSRPLPRSLRPSRCLATQTLIPSSAGSSQPLTSNLICTPTPSKEVSLAVNLNYFRSNYKP